MTEKVRTPKKAKTRSGAFQLADGTPLNYSGLKKIHKDLIRYQNGTTNVEGRDVVIVPDADFPLGNKPLIPEQNNPLCVACELDRTGTLTPYQDYVGSENPIATILVESVSRREDDAGYLGEGGNNSWLLSLIHNNMERHGVSLKDIRLVPITRCHSRAEKKPNYKTKGNWCRNFAVQDLLKHPPRVVIPVGTSVLGLLSHKSNAGDWGGRVLTWRGWPDDWISDPDYVLDRPHPANPTQVVRSHPLFGPKPDIKIPLVPIQNPNLIKSYQNEALFEEWVNHLVFALQVGKEGHAPKTYDRPWYKISSDTAEIIRTLQKVIKFAQADPEFIVAYDTETTGLKPLPYYKRIDNFGFTDIAAGKENEAVIVSSSGHQIVFIMFRWTNPETKQPESIGFPWQYEASDVINDLDKISPWVLKLLRTAQIVGHNLTFDALFTIATVGTQETEHTPYLKNGAFNPAWLNLQDRINSICSHARWDTWHMSFTTLQKKGSLGLEILAYDWVPDLAGYEEDMTLMISLFGEQMDPSENKGGHYANCPKEYWDSHLKAYVMGDVEVTYQAREKIAEKLKRKKVYKIPLSNPKSPGNFRYYTPPSREWVYNNIVSPASRTLIKMMARGMYIDPQTLDEQEVLYPHKIEAAKNRLRETDEIIERWCQTKAEESTKKSSDGSNETTWELDLENKTLLKELLFDILKCDIQRLTKAGRKLYGENPEDWTGMSFEEMKVYAAVDKYTLNHLAVKHKNLRPLQEYRKIFKLYNTYVRTMRNMLSVKIDKKQRMKEPHLCIDHCVHASFLLTGTRSGRLSSRDPNLQQLPNEGDVKRLFTSRFHDRGCIYSADLSQIELRLMAAACGDETMMEAYFKDIDIHSLTASKIFRVPYDTFTKKHMEKLQREGKGEEAKDLELKRKIAKTTNFLTGYGGGAFGLQNVLANSEVYMEIEECEQIVISFFDAYPALKRFLGIYKVFIEENGVAVSMFGRVRQFQEVFGQDEEAKSKALRAGCNHLIQSTASDMMLICLTAIENLMRESGLNSLLVSTVHDSLVIDAIREELPEIHSIVHGVMNNIPTVIKALMPDYDTSWMVVPFAGDSEVGLNYLEGNKISGDSPDWDELLAPKKK